MTRPRRRIVDRVLDVIVRHGPLTDVRLAAIMRRGYRTPDSSTRGRRADLVRLGRVERVGRTRDGHAIYDVVGIRRDPAGPVVQQQMWGGRDG